MNYYKQGMPREYCNNAVRVAAALSHRYGSFDVLCERRAKIDSEYAIRMGFEPQADPVEVEVVEVDPDTRRFIIAARLGRTGPSFGAVRGTSTKYQAYSLS